MYSVTIRPRSEASAVFDTLQTTLLSHGFELTEKSDSEIRFRLGISGMRQRGSPLTFFSRVEAVCSGGEISISASYGNVIISSSILATLLGAMTLWTYLHLAPTWDSIERGAKELHIDPGIAQQRWYIFMPLLLLLTIPWQFSRAQSELNKLVRSLEVV